jgi:hypothetical protein
MEKIQNKLERITRKWWFFLLLLILFFIPAYASKGVDPGETQNLIKEVLSNPLIYTFPLLKPIAKIIPILLVIAIIIFRTKITRIFNIYVAVLSVALALFQTTAITGTYGFVILSGNLALTLVVALFWIWEAIANKNDFTPRKQKLWKWWVVPFAFFAFWFPVDVNAITPNFSPLYIFTNESGLTYCMMTPVILAILTLFHPNINKATFRVTSFVGIIFGAINFFTWFILNATMWWMGVLHLPLLSISIYAFIISMRNMDKGVN